MKLRIIQIFYIFFFTSDLFIPSENYILICWTKTTFNAWTFAKVIAFYFTSLLKATTVPRFFKIQLTLHCFIQLDEETIHKIFWIDSISKMVQWKAIEGNNKYLRWKWVKLFYDCCWLNVCQLIDYYLREKRLKINSDSSRHWDFQKKKGKKKRMTVGITFSDKVYLFTF